MASDRSRGPFAGLITFFGLRLTMDRAERLAALPMTDPAARTAEVQRLFGPRAHY